MGAPTEEPKRSGVTPEVVRPSTARRAALLLVSIAVAFVLLNWGARAYLDRHGTNLGYRMVHAKWDLLADMGPVDWLVLGDSAAAHGIVPEVWSEVLGGETANLAIVANLLVANDAWMLNEYIERHGPPPNVVLVHAHDIWHRGYKSALLGQIPRPWGIWRWSEPTFELAAEHERKAFLSRFLPLYAESQTLRSHLRNLGPTRQLNFSMTDSGFIPSAGHRPAALQRDVGRTRRFLRDRRFKVSRINRAGLEHVAELSKKHGFKVYLANGPMHEVLARGEPFRDYMKAWERRVSHLTKGFPNVHVLNDVVSYPAKELEIAVDHVIPEMAPDYTRRLARRLKASIAP